MDWIKSGCIDGGVNGFGAGVNGLGQELVVWCRTEWNGSGVRGLDQE